MVKHLEINLPVYPYLTDEIHSKDLAYTTNRYFDKDGFQLTELEQRFHLSNDVKMSDILNHRSVAMNWLRLDYEICNPQIILDHAFSSVRYAYQDRALRQIQEYLATRPSLRKLVHLQPKYGLDFSIDFVGQEDCFEILHIEIDSIHRPEILAKMFKLEQQFRATDWLDVAVKMQKRKDEWINLTSDDQSDWKARYFGFARAFQTLKVMGK